jgi:hypothetical protein
MRVFSMQRSRRPVNRPSASAADVAEDPVEE